MIVSMAMNVLMFHTYKNVAYKIIIMQKVILLTENLDKKYQFICCAKIQTKLCFPCIRKVLYSLKFNDAFILP